MEIGTTPPIDNMGIRVRTGVMSDIRIGTSGSREFMELEMELREEMSARFPSLDLVREDATVRALRDLYWRIGIDPTKTRPSSEALLRRLLGKGLPMINDLVDAGNLASARTIVPVGIYDLDRIEGTLLLRESEEGESFAGIGGVDSEMAAGIPVLSDDEGIIHLYPHRDSMRTRISRETRNALVVGCGAFGMELRDLDKAVAEVKRYFGTLGGLH